MRMRRAANPQILLAESEPQHEPLTAARGILFGVAAGAVSLAVLLLGARALWRILG
jgi:hypothetical protein